MLALSIMFYYYLLLYLDMFALKKKRHLKGFGTWGLKKMIIFFSLLLIAASQGRCLYAQCQLWCSFNRVFWIIWTSLQLSEDWNPDKGWWLLRCQGWSAEKHAGWLQTINAVHWRSITARYPQQPPLMYWLRKKVRGMLNPEELNQRIAQNDHQKPNRNTSLVF